MDEVSGAPRPGTTLALAAPTCAPVARRFLSSFRSTLPTDAFHLHIHRCLQLNISQTELISTPRSGSRHRHPAQPPGSGHGPVLPNSGPLHPDTTASIQAFLLASLGPPQGPSAGTPTCPLPAGSQSRSLRRPQRSLQMQTSSRNSLLQRSWWCQPNVWPRAGCLSLASSPQSAPRSPYANRNEPLRVL